MDKYQIHTGDCLTILPTLPDNSVDLILTDPPYFRVKDLPWDRQWDKSDQYIAWLDKVLAEFQRVLRPNGSLYLFASPKMAAKVEYQIAKRFEVLNHIIWDKSSEPTKALMYGPDRFRHFVPKSERIIFAEHFGADNIAKGEAGYVAKCDELRGFVFEPLRKYLADAMVAAGHTLVSVNQAWRVWKGGNGGMSSHWFTQSQWALPTKKNYIWLQSLFGGTLTRQYEDLRLQYEDLRLQYEDLRRPFQVSADVPYTDVWTFRTVPTSKDKHPCEKPQDLLRHIIAASSRPNAVVLDAFAGSGSTGEAALALGRRFIGIELDPVWVTKITKRLENVSCLPTTDSPSTPPP